MKRMLPALILCMLNISCSPKVQYIGRTYEPTSKVEIFFTPQDVIRDYEVMGKIEAQGIKGFKKMQVKIMAEAQKRGADAILISDLINENSGILGNSSTTTNGIRTGRVSMTIDSMTIDLMTTD